MPEMKLADPKFNVPNKIDLLLGAEVYCQILSEGLVKGPIGCPIAQNTRLGWILSGQVSESSKTELSCRNVITTLHTQVVEEEFDLKRFWEIESDQCLLNKPHHTPEEQKCEEFFKQTTTRDPSGRYIVKLPFKEENPNCKSGNSREIAVSRFLMQERRLAKSPNLKDLYSDVIAEYLELGHMEKVPNDEIDKSESVYLPHHAVVKLNRTTTKLRVVFDASCRDKNGVSLNSELLVGPRLQSDLRHLAMRWRLHPICLVADIVKMYRQIKVANEDVDYQRLVWRSKPQEDIEHLRLLRVTFGTASAPYLAVRALHQVAYDEGKQFPLAAERVLNDFYVDDLLTGCDTVLEGKQIFQQMNELLSKGGFELQKWSSNNETLLNEISKDSEKTTSNLELKVDEIIKILGLTWNRRTDVFEYSVQLPPISEPVTKRKVISDISKLYDPLGWLAPVIVKAKMFIQKLWLAGIGWDEELPAKLFKDWSTYRGELTALTQFRLPRWIGTNSKCITVELHGFSDASSDAYAAVVYARVVDEAGNVMVTLITCKTKVAPIKQISIPKLELCGAVLLAKLLKEVSEILKVPKSNLHAWTDSTIVLAWLSSHPSRWKTFIANRVSEILAILDREQWSHVVSSDNPADCASRGVNPSEYDTLPLWKSGPAWLKNITIEHDRTDIKDTNLEEKEKKAYHESTKHHLKRVIGTATLTYEEISTLLYQIEACLNSRPLSQISTNSQDPTPLTPGHFIIGEPLVLVPDNNYETSTISSLKRWQITQQMLQVFWRRWSNEYLTQFLQRYKWANKTPEPRIGDVVLVKEDDLPPAKWLMGIITEKHKGLDNLTRVVSIKCRDTIIKRPVVKLCVLPVAE
ncbi:uncharacterized protein LOC114351861 [Ostrinia furnacalis]|uniref:uncharacterized protein LOC114351861 n=1 Tax=Ostrinia furnacalis TaxID=93504 RepID=UPI00103BCEC6|nr:uncharacterized protein LOC114351861 [Ostrinia furnacalis]